MAFLIAAAFLSCCWFTSSPGQIVPLTGMPRSHCSSNSSFISSQKLCRTQQATITVQQLCKFRSSRFARAGNLPFNLPYPFSTTTLVVLRRLLNCNSSALKFPRSTYGFISQSCSGYAESPSISGGTLTPLIVSYTLLSGVKTPPQRDVYSEEFLNKRASCTFPGHPRKYLKTYSSHPLIPVE